MWKCDALLHITPGRIESTHSLGYPISKCWAELGNVSGDPKGNASKHSKNERQLLVQSASPCVRVIEFGNYNLLLLSGPVALTLTVSVCGVTSCFPPLLWGVQKVMASAGLPKGFRE